MLLSLENTRGDRAGRATRAGSIDGSRVLVDMAVGACRAGGGEMAGAGEE